MENCMWGFIPQAEYGYVITSEQVYLDTILEKNKKTEENTWQVPIYFVEWKHQANSNERKRKNDK